MPAPMLEVTQLTKAYGQYQALADLSFTAAAGEIVGFVGPNGAGKTTTIRILATVLEPTSGEFRVAGIPRNRPDEIRRRIGVLPESAGYPAGRTGQEYLRYFGRLFGLGREAADRRARSLLAEPVLTGAGEWSGLRRALTVFVAAKAAGLAIKINAVALKGVNEDDIESDLKSIFNC